MNTYKIINQLLPIYFFIGMMKGITIFSHLDYVVSLIIQIFILVIFYKNKITKKIFLIYVLNVFIIMCIGIYFAIIGSELTLIMNRVLPLLSVFGLIIINANTDIIDVKIIIEKTIKLFVILGVIIIFDSLSFMILSKSFWPPISYLGYRFNGPFYDSNFMGITYGVLILLMLYMKFKRKKLYLLISIVCVLLAKSWSTIIFLILSILLHTIMKIKFKNLFIKQIIFIITDILFIFISSKYINVLFDGFISILSNTNFSLAELIAKFKSFEYRIVTQNNALKMFLLKPFGYGPRTIVPYLNMDIHNSYLGFLFEQGIFGTLLQIINIPMSSNKTMVADIISTFLFVVAFFINIHYSSIFVFGLMIMFYCNDKGGTKNEIFNNFASI